MTDNNHPITPPTDLVIDWRLDPGYIECTEKVTMVTMTTGRLQYIATQAARWGADQELEACCEFEATVYSTDCAYKLRRHRRPKPPSLKAQAIEVLDDIDTKLDAVHYNVLRRALEQLND